MTTNRVQRPDGPLCKHNLVHRVHHGREGEEDFSAKERRACRSVRVNREQRGMSDTAAHRIHREAMQSYVSIRGGVELVIHTSAWQMAAGRCLKNTIMD